MLARPGGNQQLDWLPERHRAELRGEQIAALNDWLCWGGISVADAFNPRSQGAEPAFTMVGYDHAGLWDQVYGSFVSLDWQHATYIVWPHALSGVSEPIPTPILPDGDYYFHVATDLAFGILGHPWQQILTVFGDQLIETFEPPSFLKPISSNE